MAEALNNNNSTAGSARLGIDIGSTTVKVAFLDEDGRILFSDYKRHFARIRETLSDLLSDAYKKLGNRTIYPMITGSGGLTLALGIVSIVVGVTTGVFLIITGAKLISGKKDLMF